MLSAGIERALDTQAEKLAVVLARAHVIDVPPVADLIPIAIGLSFVLVVGAIKAAIKIILILPPGRAGHHMDAVAVLTPRIDALRQAGVDAIDNGDIRTEVALWRPRSAGLETGAFQNLVGVGRKKGRFIRRIPNRG